MYSSLSSPTVAVGMPVARHPPHRSPRAALPHEALISDVWRQSGLGGKDEEHAAAESSGQPACASAPTSDDVSGPDGSTWSSRAGSPDSGMRTDCRCSRHRVVVEVALDDRQKPLADLD